MNLNIVIAIIALIGYAFFIFYTRKSHTFENYSVADRKIGFFLLFASLSANFIGPGFTLGLTQKGFTSGYFYLFIAGAYGLGKIIEGLYLAPIIREKFTDALSIGDVVAGPQSHNNRLLKFLVGLISFGLLVGLSVVMSKAGGEILNNFLGIPNLYGTIAVTSIVTGYSIFGGLKSTMRTDALQFVAFIILLPLLGLIVIFQDSFNYSQFIELSSNLTLQGFQENSGVAIFAMILSWGFGEMLMPFTVNTILAGESKNTAKKALSYSGMLMIVWLLLMLTLGIFAKVSLGNIEMNDQVLLNLGKSFYPIGLFGLFTIAIIGVVMSSQDALLNCGSVVFTHDILGAITHIEKSRLLKISKIAGVMIGLLSIVFASYIPSVIDGLLLFYGIWVPSVLVVALFSIFLSNPSAIAGIFSLIIGVVTSIFWNLTIWKDFLPNILIGTLCSTLVYTIIYLFKKK